ncbi:hypothetical protein [Rhodopirellula sp. P2]|uniref:hypothetical protein n=1 Tax=Rhodopirellula sp. P2 TaxID=2127060 RepID=UPI002367FA87|nr:hypothetical protein [Rhodopirellula sp. P2]WDQ19228.1 hypothetical protein PSR62_12015 [Rhodopirellula sp. P2]
MTDEDKVLFEKEGRCILEERLGDLGYSFTKCMNEGRNSVLVFRQQESWFAVTLEDAELSPTRSFASQCLVKAEIAD